MQIAQYVLTAQINITMSARFWLSSKQVVSVGDNNHLLDKAFAKAICSFRCTHFYLT